jgi:hypothetical protein
VKVTNLSCYVPITLLCKLDIGYARESTDVFFTVNVVKAVREFNAIATTTMDGSTGAICIAPLRWKNQFFSAI